MAAYTEHAPSWPKLDHYGGNMQMVQAESSYQNCAMWRQPYNTFTGYGTYGGQEFPQGFPSHPEDTRGQHQGTSTTNTWVGYQNAANTTPPSVNINVNVRPGSTGLENDWNFLSNPVTTANTPQTTSYGGYRPTNVGHMPSMDYTSPASNGQVGSGTPPMPISPDMGDGSPGSQGGGMNPGVNRQTQRPPYDWMKKVAYPTAPTSGKTRTKDKYRVVYSDHQRLELEKEFHYSRYITIRRKAELAQNLSLSERQVKIWFQNRRAKERKQNKKRDEALCNVKQEMPVTLPHQTSPPPAMVQHTPIPNSQTVTCTSVVTSPLQS